jgi:hypothetical protein
MNNYLNYNKIKININKLIFKILIIINLNNLNKKKFVITIKRVLVETKINVSFYIKFLIKIIKLMMKIWIKKILIIIIKLIRMILLILIILIIIIII